MKQKSIYKIALGYFGSHIVAVILCLIITLSLITLTQTLWVQVLMSILVLLIYWGIIGSPAYKLGYDDLNRVNFKRMEPDLLRGFKIGLLASIPMFLQSLVLIIGKFQLIPDFFVAYKLANSHLLLPINFVNLTGYLTQISWLQLILICLFNFITSILIGVSYIMGYKNITVMDKIIYQKAKPEKK